MDERHVKEDELHEAERNEKDQAEEDAGDDADARGAVEEAR